MIWEEETLQTVVLFFLRTYQDLASADAAGGLHPTTDTKPAMQQMPKHGLQATQVQRTLLWYMQLIKQIYLSKKMGAVIDSPLIHAYIKY